MNRLLQLVLLFFFMAGPPAIAGQSDYTAVRKQMVEAIAQDARDTSKYIDKNELDPRVMAAIGKVPRHEFVPTSQRAYAYENRPLAIGHGQTISQPYIVALMTDLIRPEEHHRILEIGTGSGYQAAVLAQLSKTIFSIEIIEPLGKSARQRFQQLGYTNITSRIGDGYHGWEDQAPFDAIVVTAAASHIPPPLIRQLKPGGRMIIPVGSRFLTQQLMLVTKDDKGQVTTEQVLPVAFVPLTGEH
jgi:protein-L-isoaspartate(D-aspartate) O-methyltransferase